MASSVGETPMSNSRALAVEPAEAKKNENGTHLILRYGKAQKMANPVGIHHGALDAPDGTSNAQRWFVNNLVKPSTSTSVAVTWCSHTMRMKLPNQKRPTMLL